MATIQPPSCDTPFLAELPLPDQLQCTECGTVWTVAEDPSGIREGLARWDQASRWDNDSLATASSATRGQNWEQFHGRQDFRWP